MLDDIPGIGSVRKKQLLNKFKSVSAIQKAEVQTLATVLPRKQAKVVYEYFHQNQGDENLCE